MKSLVGQHSELDQEEKYFRKGEKPFTDITIHFLTCKPELQAFGLCGNIIRAAAFYHPITSQSEIITGVCTSGGSIKIAQRLGGHIVSAIKFSSYVSTKSGNRLYENIEEVKKKEDPRFNPSSVGIVFVRAEYQKKMME